MRSPPKRTGWPKPSSAKRASRWTPQKNSPNALERPTPDNFEFGGYTHFSGSRIGNPGLGTGRPHVEQELQRDLGGPGQLLAHKGRHTAGLQIAGPERLAKVLPVARGADYPVGSGIYQCNIPRPIACKVAAFVAPGGLYLGKYD